MFEERAKESETNVISGLSAVPINNRRWERERERARERVSEPLLLQIYIKKTIVESRIQSKRAELSVEFGGREQ